MKININNLKYAWGLFRSVRRNTKEGFIELRELRFVCRYHTYICYRDFDLRDKFQDPASRRAFIQTCNECLKEVDWLYRNGLFDNFNHYLYCHWVLLALRLLAQRLPLLWNLAFLLPLQ